MNGDLIQIDIPARFPAEEIVVSLKPEDGLAPELFDVEIIACIGKHIIFRKEYTLV